MGLFNKTVEKEVIANFEAKYSDVKENIINVVNNKLSENSFTIFRVHLIIDEPEVLCNFLDIENINIVSPYDLTSNSRISINSLSSLFIKSFEPFLTDLGLKVINSKIEYNAYSESDCKIYFKIIK